jgi:DNA-binding MarR family transcriptional regulator
VSCSSTVSDGPGQDREAGKTRPAAEVAAHLVRAVWQLRRVVRRQVPRRLDHPALSPAQLELLGLVYEHPGIAVKDAADTLRLGPNTVSTLVNQLAAAGLLRRAQAASDQRLARLDLTGTAARLAATRFDEGTRLLTGALERLSARERRTLAAALPRDGPAHHPARRSLTRHLLAPGGPSARRRLTGAPSGSAVGAGRPRGSQPAGIGLDGCDVRCGLPDPSPEDDQEPAALEVLEIQAGKVENPAQRPGGGQVGPRQGHRPEEHTARAEDPGHLGHGRGRAGEEVKTEDGDHGGEGAIPEGKAVSVAPDEAGAGVAGVRRGQHSRREVDADAGVGEQPQVLARAGGEVEDRRGGPLPGQPPGQPIPAPRHHERQEPVGHDSVVAARPQGVDPAHQADQPAVPSLQAGRVRGPTAVTTVQRRVPLIRPVRPG